VEVYVYRLPDDERLDLPFGQGPVPVGKLLSTVDRVDVMIAPGDALYVLAINYGEPTAKVTVKVVAPLEPTPVPQPAVTATPTEGPQLNRMTVAFAPPAAWQPLFEGQLVAVRDSWQHIETFTFTPSGETTGYRWETGLNVYGAICADCGQDPVSAEKLAQDMANSYHDWQPTIGTGTIQIGDLTGYYAEARSHSVDDLYSLSSYMYLFHAVLYSGDAYLSLNGTVSVDANSTEAGAATEGRFNELIGELWEAIGGLEVTLEP
jgi:hypothetical protein